MNIVVDTNILFAAFIRDSTTRKIILMSGANFFYPEVAYHEINKHIGMLLNKSLLSETELAELTTIILKKINLSQTIVFNKYLKEAIKLLNHRDPDDVVFLALAMSINNGVIWSDDKDFDTQKRIRVLKTKDMANMFKHVL